MPINVDWSVLKKRIKKTKKNTEEIRVKKREKKRMKFELKSEAPDFGSCQNDGKGAKKKITCYTVRSWFREGIEKNINWKVTIPPNKDWWGGKQFSLAKRLLGLYDGELVNSAVKYLCENWEEMVGDSDGRLTGLPTIELLWSSRERIFPHVERGLPYSPPQKRRMPKRDVDEYFEPGEDSTGHGW